MECADIEAIKNFQHYYLTLLHSERPKLYTILVFLSAAGLRNDGLTAPFKDGVCWLEADSELYVLVIPYLFGYKTGFSPLQNYYK